MLLLLCRQLSLSTCLRNSWQHLLLLQCSIRAGAIYSSSHCSCSRYLRLLLQLLLLANP
jgi:hypothetical protein